jgi:RNA:NAD 2'-phosphotransferase (TPT1/KptA family)
MKFKQWLLTEAIIDKEEFIKEINSTEHNFLYLQLSPDGKILMPDTVSNNAITIEKKYKSMMADGSLQPLSKNFANIINTIKKIYPEILNYVVSSTGVAGFRNPSKKYRTVQYWLDQQRTEPKANLPKYFYHGTSTNLYNMFIKEQGLVPRQISGSSGSYGASSARALSRGMFNYLTIHPDYATREAATQAARNHGGLPLILKIDSSAIDPTRLFPDEDARAETWEESMHKIGTIAYKGIIQNSSIIPYEISKDINALKWLPYEETPTMDHPIYEKLIRTKEHRNKDSIFFALYDTEIIDRKGKLLKPITSEEFNEIIKNAKWATNAWLIYESMNDGALGHTRNSVISRSNFDKEAQQIILDLYNNGILDDYLEMKSEYIYIYDDAIQAIIKHAKHLGKNSWKEIEQKLRTVYSRKNRDQNDFLYSTKAKEILGIT